MTWSARITKVDGSVPEGKHNACEVCLHAQKNKALPERVWRPCWCRRSHGRRKCTVTVSGI